MKKLFLVIFLTIIFPLLLWSCAIFKKIGDEAINSVTKNNCGILVFKDSLQYNLVYDYLEYSQNEFQKSLSFPTAPDEEKPLTDFEILKNHSSYRTDINNQETIAETNGIDLSINPVPEILDDDEILQTLLNKDRMVIINNIVYYYFDDCTLFKFPVNNDCSSTKTIALEYFSKYDYNLLNNIKPSFNYERINICESEINFRVMSFCQEIKIEECVSNECQPGYVDFNIYFPNIHQTSFQLISCSYKIDGGTPTGLNINNASLINTNGCGFVIGSYGFRVSKFFPTSNTNHNIEVFAKFQYRNLQGNIDACTQSLIKNFRIENPCSISTTPNINNLVVSLDGVDNPCTSGTDNFSFTSNGNYTIGFQNNNSIILKYSCAGEKTITIKNNDPNCPKTKIIKVTTTDPSLCCKYKRTYCWKHIDYGNDRILVKLRERCNKLIAIVRNFSKSGNRYKRTRTQLVGDINGILYFEKNTCFCQGNYSFNNAESFNKRKARFKFKLNANRANIENASGKSLKWFKEKWARKDTNPWKFDISTSNIPNQVFKINCTNSGNACDQ